MRCVPVSAHETRLYATNSVKQTENAKWKAEHYLREYDVYKHRSMGMDELKEFMKFYGELATSIA